MVAVDFSCLYSFERGMFLSRFCLDYGGSLCFFVLSAGSWNKLISRLFVFSFYLHKAIGRMFARQMDAR